MKTCCICKVAKPSHAFGKNLRAADGLQYRCKECHRVEVRMWQRENREKHNADVNEFHRSARGKAYLIRRNLQWRAMNPDKFRASKLLHSAIRNGTIKRRPCVTCGAAKADGHHEDYKKPLEVIWYCRKHHRERHLVLAEDCRRAAYWSGAAYFQETA